MKHDPFIENNIGVALPSQIEDDIFQLIIQLTTTGEPADTLTVISKIVSDLEKRAQIILLMNNATPSASKPSCSCEVKQPPAVANSKAVLYYAEKIKTKLKKKKLSEAILIMFKLASSAVRAELLQKAFEGCNLMVAQEKGGKASSKLKSLIPLLEQAIASGCKPNAKALWNYIEKHHQSDTPFTFEVRKEIEPPPSKKRVNKFKGKGPSTSTEIVDTLELYFDSVKNKKTNKSEETLVELNSKNVEKTLNFSSFKRYVTEVKKLHSKK